MQAKGRGQKAEMKCRKLKGSRQWAVGSKENAKGKTVTRQRIMLRFAQNLVLKI
jgi:hypothetical protein